MKRYRSVFEVEGQLEEMRASCQALTDEIARLEREKPFALGLKEREAVRKRRTRLEAEIEQKELELVNAREREKGLELGLSPKKAAVQRRLRKQAVGVCDSCSREAARKEDGGFYRRCEEHRSLSEASGQRISELDRETVAVPKMFRARR